MRVFTLVNSENKSIDITTKELFFHGPSGLGYNYSYDFRQVGNRYVAVNRNMSQKSITGKVALLGEDPYLQYFNLVRFLSKVPLVLKYIPNNEGKGEESRTVYNLDVVVQKLEKTELEKVGYLDCSITLQALGPWYKEIVMDRGNILDSDSVGAVHKLIWKDSIDEEVDGDAAMEWLEDEDKVVTAQAPTMTDIEEINEDKTPHLLVDGNNIVDGEGTVIATCILDDDSKVKYIDTKEYSSTLFYYPVKFETALVGGETYKLKFDRRCTFMFEGTISTEEIVRTMISYEGQDIGEFMEFTLPEKFNGFDVEYNKTVIAYFNLSPVKQYVMPPVVTRKQYVEGSIKFSDEDSSTNGIFADTAINNPSRLTIYGPTTGNYIEWALYVDGIKYSDGKLTNIQLLPDECVVIDNISVPGLIYKKNMVSGAVEDVYSKSDFTTTRFITPQNGVNTVTARSEYSELNVKWEVRLQYESV